MYRRGLAPLSFSSLNSLTHSELNYWTELLKSTTELWTLIRMMNVEWLLTYEWIRLSLSLMLLPTVSRPVCLRIKHPSGAYDQIFITVRQLRVCWYGALSLSDERTGLSFTIAAGPSQRSHSRVRAPWDSQPYFIVSDLRLPFSSPPTTRRVTVEVFDPASTRVEWIRSYVSPPLYLRGGPNMSHHLQQFRCYCVLISCCGNVSSYPLPSNGCLPLLIT
jgi:hypothetical protein